MGSYYVPSDIKKQQILELKDFIGKTSGVDGLSLEVDNDELTVKVGKENILRLVKFLKSNNKCLFKQLVDITAVDYPEREDRFEVVYHLLSMVHNLRIRIKTFSAEHELISSLDLLYDNADWLEREVWDMFGIYFKGHKDLRRILTDFGFDGHPLRKDFPLTGFMEMKYDEDTKKVAYQPVELMQVYRDFNYRNPWLSNIESDTFLHIKKNEDNESK